MGYLETYKKRKEAGLVGTSSAASQDDGESTSGHGYTETYKRRRAAGKVAKRTLDTGDMQSFFDAAEKYTASADSVQDYNSGMKFRKEHASEGKQLISQARSIRAALNQNRDTLDADSYGKLSTSVKGVEDYLKSFEARLDSYGKYESEGDYRRDMAGWLSDEGRTDAATVAERRRIYDENTTRIEELRSVVDDLEKEYRRYNMGHKMATAKAREDTKKKLKSARDELEGLEAENNRYEREQGAVDSYYGVTRNVDFEDVSAKRPEAASIDEYTKTYSDWYKKYNEYTSNPALDPTSADYTAHLASEPKIDDEYGYYLRNRDALAADKNNNLGASKAAEQITAEAAIERGNLGDWDRLTDDEVSIYYYLYNKEGAAAAKKYLSDMEVELNRRRAKAEAEAARQAALDAGFWENALATVASIPVSVLSGGVAFADQAWRRVTGQATNPYTYANRGQIWSESTRGGIAENIERATDGANILGFSFGDAYQAIASGGDSMFGAALGSGVYGALMGMGAASSEARRLYEEGASEGQIAAGAILSGAAEMAFEKWSIDKLFELEKPTTIKGVLKNALKQAIPEFQEEACTEIANTITDAIVRGSQSDFQKNIAERVKAGESESAASAHAVIDVLGDAVKAGTAGALSGGLTGALYSAAEYNAYSAEQSANYENIGRTALAADGGDALMRLAYDRAKDVLAEKDGRSERRQAQKLRQAADRAATELGREYNNPETAQEKASRAIGKVARAIDADNARTARVEIKSSLKKEGVSDRGIIKTALNRAHFKGNTLTLATDYLDRVFQGVEEFSSETASKRLRRIGDSKEETAARVQKVQDVYDELRAEGTDISNRSTEAAKAVFGIYDTDNIPIERKTDAAEIRDSGKISEEARGTAYNKHTGDDFVFDTENPVAGVKTVDGKQVVEYRGTNGAVLSSDNVVYADEDQAVLFEGISDLPAAMQNRIVSAYNQHFNEYDGSISVADFVSGAREGMLLFGKYGTADTSQDSYFSRLSEADKALFSEYGRKFAEMETAERQSRVDKMKAAAREAGEQRRGYGGVTLDASVDEKTFNREKRAEKRFIEVLSEAVGIDAVIYDSRSSTDPIFVENNGYYSRGDGKIYIDIAAGENHRGQVAFTLSHELCHFIEDWSPAKYKVFADFLVKEYGRHGVSVDVLIREKMRELGITDHDTAYSEVIADACERMLLDSNAAEKLAQLRQKDRGLFKKIMSRIREALTNLRRLYKNAGYEASSKEARALREMVDVTERIYALFEDAAVSAAENYKEAGRAAEHGVDTDTVSQKKSTQDEVKKEYEKTVDGILNGTQHVTDSVLLGYTPELLQDIGMPALPFVIGPGHIYSIAKTEIEARNEGKYNKSAHYHGLGATAVKQIYKSLNDPVAIISAKDTQSAKKDAPRRSVRSVVAIIDIGSQSEHLLIPVEITAERRLGGNRMDVNVLSSAYQKNVGNLFAEAIAQENAGDVGIYYATKKATMLTGAGVQFPKQLQRLIASTPIIHKFSEKVNMQISDVTQSQQFKRWFGDWQNHPEDASKVVNDDGTPKVVYHGTNAEFWTFDIGKSGENFGDVSEGLFFFTNKKNGYPDSASDYAKNAAVKGGDERIVECYLDIKKPLQLYSDGYYTPTAYFDNNSEAIYDKYLRGNYDGIIIENSNKSVDDSVIYLLDDPTQIKSATDNIGTFDGNNPDIRYQKRGGDGSDKGTENGFNEYSDYDRAITPHDVEVMRSIGRKSVNDFTSEDIQKTQKWAHKFYRELGVKSPFFRAWFGDWRASDTSEVKIIDTEGDLRSPSERNNDTGWNIIVSRQVAKETTHHSSDKVKNAVKYLPYIKDITQNAVLLDTYTSGKDNPLSLFFHSMYAYTEVMGYPALVKLKVEELINEKDGSSIRRDYILQNIEEEPISEVERFSKALHHENGSSMYSVSELYSLVKPFDKDFTPAHEVPSVLLNDDGTPKVFYHGTMADFTEFRSEELSPVEGSYFFAENKEDAEGYGSERYGGHVMEVYLTGENFADYNDQPSEFYNLKDKRDQVQWLKERGYDGWYADMDSGGWGEVSVFSPTQIKSATDNIGTFDRGNTDTQHQKRSAGRLTDAEVTVLALESAAKSNVEEKTVREMREKLDAMKEHKERAKELLLKIRDAEAAENISSEDRRHIREMKEERKAEVNRADNARTAIERLATGKIGQSLITRKLTALRRAKNYERDSAVARAVSDERKKTDAAVEELRSMTTTAARYKAEVSTAQSANEKLHTVIEAYKAEISSAKADAKATADWYRAERDRDVAATREKYLSRAEAARETRERTELKRKIVGVAKELSGMLLKNDRRRNIKIDLQAPVAEALSILDIYDTGSAGKIAKINAELEQLYAKPETVSVKNRISELLAYRDRLEASGESTAATMSALLETYKAIGRSGDDAVRTEYSEDVYNLIDSIRDRIGDTPLYQMDAEMLRDVYDVYGAILHAVRESNKDFARSAAARTAKNGEAAIAELRLRRHRTGRYTALDSIKSAAVETLKPIYFFDWLDSGTLSKLYDDIQRGEGNWGHMIADARTYLSGIKEKHGADGWDFNKEISFGTLGGQKMTLGQVMSLYALWQREAAKAHLTVGGVVIAEKPTGPFGKTSGTSQRYVLGEEDILAILGELTDEQRGFVRDAVGYLTDTLGQEGNKVSREQWGIDLFREKWYFPIQTSEMFRHTEIENTDLIPSISNPGFSRATNPKSNNPVVLRDFLEVWGGHVNDMSQYCSFAIPVEGLKRVLNYQSADTSVKQALEEGTNGRMAQDYIFGLIRDLSKGARKDPRDALAAKLMSGFKKGATLASLSVVIQQPSSIGRAFSVIPAYYFHPGDNASDAKGHRAKWEELKKYSGIAVIKEMGQFDVNNGRSTSEWLLDRGPDGIIGAIDEKLGSLPGYADEVTWVAIWNAAKRMVRDRMPGIESRSEKFYTEAAKIFDDCIIRTQVYDSTLSRSGLMRSKNGFAQMMTAFMAEPITQINMQYSALRRGRRGDHRGAVRIWASVATAQILNAAFAALVYALRDDGEDDETYLERYLGSFAGELIDSINPLTAIPIAKDIYSLMQGYDVSRSDMTLISQLWKSTENLYKMASREDATVEDWVTASAELAGNIVNIFGIPARNIVREGKSIWNTSKTFIRGNKTMGSAISDKVLDEIIAQIPIANDLLKRSNADKMYSAMVKGDDDYLKRLFGRYKKEETARSQLRGAIEERYVKGKLSREEAERYLLRYVVTEENKKKTSSTSEEKKKRDLNRDAVYWIIDKWDAKKESPTEEYGKYDDFYTAVETGEGMRKAIKKYLDGGHTAESLSARITSHYKERYIAATKAERTRLKGYLLNAYTALGYDRDEKADDIDGWLDEKE